jgi:hypothetical protein
VLRKVLSVIRFPDDPSNCPIVLVHGVFGSGKSTLVSEKNLPVLFYVSFFQCAMVVLIHVVSL